MNTHRCTECTLLRCEVEGQICQECLANMVPPGKVVVTNYPGPTEAYDPNATEWVRELYRAAGYNPDLHYANDAWNNRTTRVAVDPETGWPYVPPQEPSRE